MKTQEETAEDKEKLTFPKFVNGSFCPATNARWPDRELTGQEIWQMFLPESASSGSKSSHSETSSADTFYDRMKAETAELNRQCEILQQQFPSERAELPSEDPEDQVTENENRDSDSICSIHSSITSSAFDAWLLKREIKFNRRSELETAKAYEAYGPAHRYTSSSESRHSESDCSDSCSGNSLEDEAEWRKREESLLLQHRKQEETLWRQHSSETFDPPETECLRRISYAKLRFDLGPESSKSEEESISKDTENESEDEVNQSKSESSEDTEDEERVSQHRKTKCQGIKRFQNRNSQSLKRAKPQKGNNRHGKTKGRRNKRFINRNGQSLRRAKPQKGKKSNGHSLKRARLQKGNAPKERSLQRTKIPCSQSFKKAKPQTGKIAKGSKSQKGKKSNSHSIKRARLQKGNAPKERSLQRVKLQTGKQRLKRASLQKRKPKKWKNPKSAKPHKSKNPKGQRSMRTKPQNKRASKKQSPKRTRPQKGIFSKAHRHKRGEPPQNITAKGRNLKSKKPQRSKTPKGKSLKRAKLPNGKSSKGQKPKIEIEFNKAEIRFAAIINPAEVKVRSGTISAKAEIKVHIDEAEGKLQANIDETEANIKAVVDEAKIKMKTDADEAEAKLRAKAEELANAYYKTICTEIKGHIVKYREPSTADVIRQLMAQMPSVAARPTADKGSKEGDRAGKSHGNPRVNTNLACTYHEIKPCPSKNATTDFRLISADVEEPLTDISAANCGIVDCQRNKGEAFKAQIKANSKARAVYDEEEHLAHTQVEGLTEKTSEPGTKSTSPPNRERLQKPPADNKGPKIIDTMIGGAVNAPPISSKEKEREAAHSETELQSTKVHNNKAPKQRQNKG